MDQLDTTPLALKPLPMPNWDDKPSPPLPPSLPPNLTIVPPPPPPPKAESETNPAPDGITAVSPMIPDFGPPSPLVPQYSAMPLSPPADGKPSKTNPLTDFIDTEKTYVDQLTGIIRKVAAAWSRSNLPPPELDSIFRSVESVYKANRSLLSKLKEIGTNPSSPKALGDLLMRWIDDLEGPYTTYCSKYCTGFDAWGPIQANARLPTILAKFSEANPPPLSLISQTSEAPIWTLDALFLLPKMRLKYYKKLYTRLQKSTAPGRSDHRLLIGALEKLDILLATIESRETIRVGEISQELPEPPNSADDVGTSQGLQINSMAGDSARSSQSSGDSERFSRETGSSSMSRGSTMTMAKKMPIADLERRLATERTLDIFSMTPKVVRLQINPPSIPFNRELRCSVDVVIHFTPRSTGMEVVHRRGHIFLLSDLFLVCEHMTPDDRAQRGSNGADMWLCYPPLAGKVLRVSEVGGQDNALQVAVMKKETLILETESTSVRDFMISEFRECIEFAGRLQPPTGQPPPMFPSQELLPPPPVPRDIGYGGQPQFMPHNGAPVPMMAPTPILQSVPRGPPSFNPSPVPTPPPQYATGPPPGGNPSRAGPQPGEPFNHPIRNQTLPLQPQPQPQRQGSFPPHATSNYVPPDQLFPGIQASSSSRSLYSHPGPPGQGRGPPLPPQNGYNPEVSLSRNGSYNPPMAPQPRALLPSAQFNPRSSSSASGMPSPPGSPVEESVPTGPTTSTIAAQMKCKIFLQQQHAQWKSLGAAKLKLYLQQPTNVKQLVVEADNRAGAVLISTIVLTDGVERVGKTGVAVELSDKGTRTGIIYMIQLRNETSAGGLFDSLLAGSDRAGRG